VPAGPYASCRFVGHNTDQRAPITAAAFNVFLAGVVSRSMRASMAACTVAATLSSPTSVPQSHRARRLTRRAERTHAPSLRRRNGFPAARSAMVTAGSPTEGSDPSSAASRAVVSEHPVG